MHQVLGFEGRVLIRLSEVPLKKRQLAAERLAALEIKNAKTPGQALRAASIIRFVADDPERAAREVPEECENRTFPISQRAYERIVLGKRSARGVGAEREEMASGDGARREKASRQVRR